MPYRPAMIRGNRTAASWWMAPNLGPRTICATRPIGYCIDESRIRMAELKDSWRRLAEVRMSEIDRKSQDGHETVTDLCDRHAVEAMLRSEGPRRALMNVPAAHRAARKRTTPCRVRSEIRSRRRLLALAVSI